MSTGPYLRAGTKIPARLLPIPQVWNEYAQVVPVGVSLEEVLSRDYWRLVESQLKPLDRLHLVAEDRSFDALVRLDEKKVSGLKFTVLRLHEAEPATPIRRESMAGKYRIQNGGSAGWQVIDTSNHKAVADGLSKDDAEAERRRLLGPFADDA
jgi:hypothetical protein